MKNSVANGNNNAIFSITQAKKSLSKVENDCYSDNFIAPEKTLVKDYLNIWIDNHAINLESTTLYCI